MDANDIKMELGEGTDYEFSQDGELDDMEDSQDY